MEKRANANAVIFAVFLAEMSATFESAMIFGALPKLIGEYGDPVKAGWLVTTHMLVSAATYAVAGRLGDIRGRKQIMLGLIAIAACGSLLSAVTTSFAMVLAGRALQGFGSAVMPLSIGVLRENLPEERMPVSVGLMTTASGAGVVLGLFLGGWILDNLNWHWLFTASAILLAISWIAIQVIVPSRPGTPPKHPIDWIEGLLPALTIVALLLGLSLTKDLGWMSWKIAALLGGGIVLAVWWARRALSSPEPFVDLRMFANRNVAAGNLLGVLMGLGTANVVLVFSAYIQSPAWTGVGLGMTALGYAQTKLPSNFVSFFAGPISGKLMQRWNARVPVVLGCVLSGTGWLVAMLMPNTALQAMLLICWISFGTTLLNAAMPNIIVASVPSERTGEAIGTMSVVRGIFGSIGTQLLALILATGTIAAPDGKGHFPSATGFYAAMGWIAAMSFAVVLVAFMLGARKTRAPVQPVEAT